MLFQALVHQREREARAVDRHLQVAQDVGQRADVVFMAVGQQDGAQVLPVLLEVGDVGNDDVHAEQFGLGEHHARIDQNHVVARAENEHVHAELAQSAQGNC